VVVLAWKNISIARQVFILVLGTVAVVVAGLAWFSLSRQLALLESGLRARGDIIGRTVAGYCAAPLLFEDASGAEQILGQLAAAEEVESAELFQRAGNRLARWSRSAAAAPAGRPARDAGGGGWTEVPAGSGRLRAPFAVQFKGRVEGTLLLELSDRLVRAEVRRSVQAVAALALVLLVLGSALGFWLVHAKTAELQSGMERFRSLLESTNAVRWELDPAAHVFSYLSPQAKALLGQEAEEIVGQAGMLERLVHRDDLERVRRELSALADPGGRRDLDLEYRMETARGEVVDVRSLVSAVDGGAGRPRLLRGLTFDVTRQKHLERELRQAQKLESVGRLAAGIAHEINTPVQFVNDSIHFVRDSFGSLAALIDRSEALGQAVVAGRPAEPLARQLLEAEEEDDLGYLKEHVPKALDRAIEGLVRIGAIVRSMKEFAHPDSKEMTQLQLNHAIESTLVIARNEYKFVADVETQLGEVPPVTCYGGEVNQVILNILVNAAHAIEARVKGSTLRGHIVVRSQREGDAVLVSISDDGGGIPEAIRERIFDPFFTTKEVGKGTGQGLAIARSVVTEKHGGSLTFESEIGKGTTFFIRLPIEGRKQGERDVAA
jgi:PAS domain S-box-containing protein